LPPLSALNFDAFKAGSHRWLFECIKVCVLRAPLSTPMSSEPDPSIEKIAALRAGLERRSLSPLMKCFGFVTKLVAEDIATQTDEQLVAAQKPLPRNFFTTAIIGRIAKGVRVSDELIPTESGLGLQVRIFTPARVTGGGMLYLHGGGWVSGDLGLTSWWCSQVAARTGTVVASLNYRLAPAYRFPAGLEDCLHALTWLMEHRGRLRFDPGNFSVGGESAGGNLAAALCLRIRHQGGAPAIARQILIYPALDLTFASPSMTENMEDPILSVPNTHAYGARYLGPASAREPLASPLLAEDLTRMPPALIQVAEHDPLRDDGWRYALRLREAGVSAEITEYAGVPHGFTLFPGVTPLASKALEEACGFLGTAVLP
jgi:acetyl esterase